MPSTALARVRPLAVVLALLLALTGLSPVSATADPGPEGAADTARSAPEQPEEPAPDADPGEDAAAPQQSAATEEAAVGMLDGLDDGDAADAPTLDPALAAAAEETDQVDVVVHLQEQVDSDALLEQAQAVAMSAEVAAAADTVTESHEAGRQARGAYVVEALQEVAEGPARDRVIDSLETLGARDVEGYWIVNAVSATVDSQDLAELAQHPDISRVALDEELRIPDTLSEPNLPTWGHEKIKAPQTWGEYGHRGEGVVVAVLDSGVDGGHPALAGSYRGADGDHSDSWYVATSENYPEPFDGNGHGTHVTGTITGDAPGERVGVAPDAEWIGVKIFDDAGGTSDSTILGGAQWILAPGGDPAMAPDVANNSWGHPDPSRTLYWDSVQAWRAAGIFPVFANGNDGPGSGTVGSPGSFPMSFGVGATTSTDQIASFSSRGPVTWDGEEIIKPEVSAPGHQIRSAWPRNLGQDYHTISGTSMATPHVAGAVALLLSADPGLSLEDIWETLEDTARVESHMGEVPNNAYGHGIIDVYAATTTVAHSARLTGTVTGPDGPLAAQVSVDGGDFVVTSDAETGAYAVTLPAEGAEVQVSAYGYLTQTFQIEAEVDEVLEQDVELEPAPSATVTGTVTAEGDPARGAVVTFRLGGPEGPTTQAVTDAAGTYSASVPHGDYIVRVDLAGHAPARHDVDVTGETTHDVDLTALTSPANPGWSQFQNGPGRAGLSTHGVTPSAFEQAWTTTLEGEAFFSSPVVHDGQLFLATSWSDGGAVTAMDAGTGQVQWTHSSGPNQRTTPAVTDEAVIFSDGDHNALVAVDPENGDLRWSYSTGEERTVYGTPVLEGDTAFFSTGLGADNGGFLHAVDVETGEQRWRSEVGPQGLMGPAVADGIVVAVSNQTGATRAFDAETGEQLWEHVQGHGLLASPTIADGVVYVATTGGVNGSLFALDLETGAVIWEVDDHGSVQNGAPAIYEDLVVAGSHGRGWVRAYDRATGELQWTYETRYAVSSPQGISGDGVVLGGSQSGVVWGLDVTTGELLWEHELTRATVSAPAIADGTAYFAAMDGSVTAMTSLGTVAGTVQDAEGGVPAYLEVVETGAGTTADEDGSFLLDHRPGDWTVRASAYGYAPADAEVLIVGGQQTDLDLTLSEVGAGSLSGTVTTAEGPADGATVTLTGPGEEPVLDPETTDPDGAYDFPDVAAGAYELRVETDGYAAASAEVTIVEGEASVVDLTLERFDVAVAADHEGQVAAELRSTGRLVDEVSLADLPGTLADYPVVVLGGTAADPADADVLEPIVAEAQEAGVSLVALDQRGLDGGSVRGLLEITEAGTLVEESHWRGTTWGQDVVPHPVTASLEPAGRTDLLRTVDATWIEDFTGHTLVRGGTYPSGPVGAVVGIHAESTDSAHVLLPLHAASPDSGPDSTWLPVMTDVLDDAVTWAATAEFGEVTGTVTGPDGTAVEVTVDVIDGPSAPSGEQGYAVLLEPGEHTLRISHAGWETVEQTVTVEAGQTHTLDWELTPAEAGTIGGQVTNQAGEAVPDAEVVVNDTDLSATTNDSGTYLLSEVPSGTWSVTATADGHSPATVDGVEVAANEEVVVDLVLPTAPSVAVLGDREGQLTQFLSDQGMPAQEADWEITEDLSGIDVAILALPSDPGQDEFLAALDAFEKAGVSVIGSAGINQATLRGGYLFQNHLGDPAEVLGVGGGGQNIHLTDDTPHPVFTGLPDELPWQVTFQGESAAFVGSSGVPIGTMTADDQDTRGPAAVYYPQANGTVHLLAGGLGATLRNDPEETWTEDGQEFYLNLVRWADQPALGEVTGTVTGPEGAPATGATLTFPELDFTVPTDDEGLIAQQLHPGTYEIRYEAVGYQDQTGTVTVVEGDSTDVSVELVPGESGTIQGTVRSTGQIGTGQIGTGAATADDGGIPLEGATVRLIDQPRQTTTDADGAYSLAHVPPGDYQLEFTAEGHLRQVLDVTVEAGEEHTESPLLRVSPEVGVLFDMAPPSRPHGDVRSFLELWGYEVTDIEGWDDLETLAGVDLLVANGANSGDDPTAAQFAAFDDVLTRNSTSTLWMGTRFGRGTIQYLHDQWDDPAAIGEGVSGGESLAVVPEEHQDHPLFTGVDLTDGTFPVIQPDRAYQWFSDYSGTSLAVLDTEVDGELGDTIAVKGRTTEAVDILLSTMASSTNGRPSLPGAPSTLFTPEAEQVYLNALTYALDAESIGGVARGVVTADGTGVASTVTVTETGRVHSGRDGDGTFVVPLDPGTWTLEVEAYGYLPQEHVVTVDAGDTAQLQIELAAGDVGAIGGVVTDHTGAPIEGVTASVGDRSTTTDGAGSYTLTTVPAGEASVQFAKDGLRTETRTVEVVSGEVTPLDVSMGEAATVALVGDRNDDMATVLRDAAYEVDTFPYPELATVTPIVETYDTVVVNGFGTAPPEEDYLAFLAAAAEAEVSVVFTGAYFSGSIRHLSDYTGDPEGIEQASVTDVVHYTVTQEHPILEGYAVGDTIRLLNREGNTVPYQSFTGYSGVTLAHHTHLETDSDLGPGLAYQFTSGNSVHILLGSLAASAYGTPADPNQRWTPEAFTVLLNSVAWSVDASQSTITGTVSSDGEPVAGASVVAVESGVQDTTSADGTYRLGVPAGIHTVEVTATGYDPLSETVEVEDQETRTLDLDLVRQPRGTLAVEVLSARDGTGLAGATVTAEGPSTAEGSTDADGQVTLEDLLPGDYTVSVTAEGHAPTSTQAEVTVETTTDVTVELAPHDVLVLGDTGESAVTDVLADGGIAVSSGDWEDIPGSLEDQRVVVVNGGDPDAETFAEFQEAVDTEGINAIFLGTDPVAGPSGASLLAAHDSEFELGVRGYGDGALQLTDFDSEHALLEGLTDPASVLATDGYYATAGSFPGESLADLRIGEETEDRTGAAVTVAERQDGTVDLVLSFLAATAYQGPGQGWTDDGELLLRNAVTWAGQHEPEPPVGVIEISPTAVEHEVEAGESDSTDVAFTNTGEAAAEVSLEAAEEAEWLAFDPASFEVEAEDAVNVAVTTDSTGLDAGTYTAAIEVTTDTGQDLADIAVTMVVTEAGEPPVDPIEVERVFGADRYETAVAVSQDYEPGVPAVFLATGGAFPDALTGSALAASEEFPVLLTRSDHLPDVTAAELERLAPERVLVLGGPAAVEDSVVELAGDLTGVTPERLAGGDRYETAAAVAAAFGTFDTAASDRVFVATGSDYADALTAAARAGMLDSPVLLVTAEHVPSATVGALDALSPEEITVLGGSEAVSDGVVETLAAWGEVERLAGEHRYETAEQLAAEWGSSGTVYLSSGQDWPDALAGSARAGALGLPVLLTRADVLPEASGNALLDLGVDDVVVLGGPTAVQEVVLDQIRELRD